ncbi:S-methyl-5-thioribose-1-phosphate isomerase [Clostridium luticellarii]|jgi:methylthioribose-1-phosphate isomerase|uniref:Methylthioribose-1-phosphate isomerase n=1 Tax=Clostridium luticellarii TaxID=1691940 RepID=A0A2T0BC65_9CLOT|nr:S-methyl-5-thioribose-1-phosphate isomerase [Clostridium luticellarii]MCI1946223.1 S-methyl-5-thioribose-1-phosphate isomerase [Clostridium luticellarii]MCI1969522.1 S-methyl-5-thioribose-1-phosphate isomerase [Clostridium luticellarii]MCI1996716.1 S-methyl-5-thioribose-1-phosphate isomerase [Clostridium luticellarii]MCI2041008.1 S-methyl-5-thioribose-1-phosphate isomerase [Clostridium luticellarii]PRR81432.1 Methylthioribose-1-phosphate isomerase [Clostridium luticellarii]
MSELFAIKWEDGEDKLVLLDQTKLPNSIEYKTYDTVEGVYDSIKTMIVRGAPAIGVTAGYGLYFGIKNAPEDSFEKFYNSVEEKAKYLNSSRPTAVNLSWALKRMLKKIEAEKDKPIAEIKKILRDEAKNIHREDIEICKNIGENLITLLKDNMGILTHCNAGQLATSRYGTATAPMYLAKEKGWHLKIYSDETRPRLQGSTLTALELYMAGIDVTTITDNMAAVVMSQHKIDAVIVGCDRIAANGDTANKIGTFGVSILAKYFKIPMYIAAPTPSIDLNTPTGRDIPIEERDSKEVTCRFGVWTAPKGVKVYNPSFDVTPHENITAIVTEKGIVYPPFEENLKKIIK